MDLLEQADPGVRCVAGGRQVTGAGHAVQQARARLTLRDRLQQAGECRGVGADAADHPLRVVVDGRRGEHCDGCERGDRVEDHDLRPGRLQARDLRPKVRVRGDVLLPRDDARGGDLRVKARDAALAEVIVLVEVADLHAREGVVDVLAGDLAFDDVVGLVTEGVRPLRGLVPAVTARSHEEVGDLLRGQVVDDRGVRRRAEAVEDGEDLVLEHELAHDGRCGLRVVAVVIREVLDRPAVHAAVVVHPLEVGVGRL